MESCTARQAGEAHCGRRSSRGPGDCGSTVLLHSAEGLPHYAGRRIVGAIVEGRQVRRAVGGAAPMPLVRPQALKALPEELQAALVQGACMDGVGWGWGCRQRVA